MSEDIFLLFLLFHSNPLYLSHASSIIHLYSVSWDYFQQQKEPCTHVITDTVQAPFELEDRAGGVVGVDQQNTGHRRVVFDPTAQFLDVREPVIVGIQGIGNRRQSGMGGFG